MTYSVEIQSSRDQICQEIVFMSDIRPGLRVEFFYYADYKNENIHVMRTILYDVMGKKMIMAQSSPSLLSASIKKNIVMTYLAKQEGKPVRFGFNAKILDLLNDYRIASGEAVSAIVIEQEGPPKHFNIRSSFRVRVPSSIHLNLIIGGERATLLDISIGGAMISGSTVKGLNQHDRIKITISFDNQVFNLEGEVLRILSPGKSSRNDLQLASLKFFNAPRYFESALGKMIFNMERQLLADDMTKALR